VKELEDELALKPLEKIVEKTVEKVVERDPVAVSNDSELLDALKSANQKRLMLTMREFVVYRPQLVLTSFVYNFRESKLEEPLEAAWDELDEVRNAAGLKTMRRIIRHWKVLRLMNLINVWKEQYMQTRLEAFVTGEEKEYSDLKEEAWNKTLASRRASEALMLRKKYQEMKHESGMRQMRQWYVRWTNSPFSNALRRMRGNVTIEKLKERVKELEASRGDRANTEEELIAAATDKTKMMMRTAIKLMLNISRRKTAWNKLRLLMYWRSNSGGNLLSARPKATPIAQPTGLVDQSRLVGRKAGMHMMRQIRSGGGFASVQNSFRCFQLNTQDAICDALQAANKELRRRSGGTRNVSQIETVDHTHTEMMLQKRERRFAKVRRGAGFVIIANTMVHWKQLTLKACLTQWRFNQKTMGNKANLKNSFVPFCDLFFTVHHGSVKIGALFGKFMEHWGPVGSLRTIDRAYFGAVATWRINMFYNKMYLITRRIGMRLMLKFLHRKFMAYVKEKIKLWDKRHDAWIAELEQAALNKAAGLKGFMTILKKWDQQKAAALLTAWNKNENEEERRVNGLKMMQKIIDGWRASIYKAVIMNLRGKFKIAQGKIKLEAKKQKAAEEMAAMTQKVKEEVNNMVAVKAKESNKQHRKNEKKLKQLEEENETLRRRLYKFESDQFA